MAEIDGDFVVFLIGARFNSFHLLRTALDLGGRAGDYEAIYGNMPPFGLGKAGRLVPLAEGKTARQRFRAAASGIAG
jgi:hypothetical protein